MEAISIIIEKFSSLGESYYQDIYLGSEFDVKIEELAQKIIELCNSKSKITVHKKSENDKYVQRLKSEPDRSFDFLGFCPIISLEDGLRELIENFRLQQNLIL